mgnify:CR=1 FL=1
MSKVISIRVDEDTYRLWLKVLKKEGVQPRITGKTRKEKKMRDVFRRILEVYLTFG